MITINSVSGGATSAYMAVHYPADYNLFCLVCTDQTEVSPKDKGLLKEVQKRIPGFIASRELDETLKLVLDLEQFIGREIIWLAALDGQSEKRLSYADTWLPKLVTYDRLLLRKEGETINLPNKAHRWCTEELKLIPQMWWRYLNIPHDEIVVMNIGLRADEDSRVRKRLAKCDRANIPTSCNLKTKKQGWFKNWLWREQNFPLWSDGIDKPHINDYWISRGWQFPGMKGPCERLEKLSGNCDMCFFKRKPELWAIADYEPDRFAWAKQKEAIAGGTFITGLTYEEIEVIRDEDALNRLQKSRSISREMKRLEAEGQGNLFEDEMCTCTD